MCELAGRGTVNAGPNCPFGPGAGKAGQLKVCSVTVGQEALAVTKGVNPGAGSRPEAVKAQR